MFCTRCGTNNENNARFCRTCAAPLGNAQSGQQTDTPYPGYQGTQNPGFQGQQTPPAPVYGQSYPNANFPHANNVSGGASGRAIASLVCMILAFVACGPFTGIPAIILGKQEMDAVKRGQAARAGEGMAKAGYYGGIVSVVLTCGGILLALGLGMLGTIFQ